MHPLILTPLIKHIRWGGTRLQTVLGKDIGGATDAAESWEVVDHGEDQSVVADGRYAGRTLRDLVAEHGQALLGRQGVTQFPLLIKFLDATDRLSLQVHPNDAQAKTYDPSENGKTEAWVIIDTTPESKIWLGLKPGVDRAAVEAAIESGRLEAVLHATTPKPGDCYFVPAGAVHAIGEGVLLAEVQQSSDITFRLHDWGRLGTDGKPRPVHIRQSLECIDYDRGPMDAVTPREIAPGVEELVRCRYFTITRHRTTGTTVLDPQGEFRILMVLDGSLECNSDGVTQSLHKGGTLLVPASCPGVDVVASEPCTWLEVEG